MKDLYREETNKDVYAEDCCMQPSSSYSDEYVHWLEAKLRQYNVIKSVCDHSWMNTGMMVQGKSLMVCTKCKETKQTV